MGFASEMVVTSFFSSDVLYVASRRPVRGDVYWDSLLCNGGLVESFKLSSWGRDIT